MDHIKIKFLFKKYEKYKVFILKNFKIKFLLKKYESKTFSNKKTLLGILKRKKYEPEHVLSEANNGEEC